jgi:hypothetical protein
MMARALLAGLIFFAAVNVHAQALYGSLVGNVVDETGATVPGATVSITQKETNQTREQPTSENGAYSFANLAPGTYDVVVTLPGFRTFASRDIIVSVGAIVRVDARLGVGALEESVVVTGEAAILQADSAALQSVTTAQALENLPINGRSYQSLLTLTPGVAQPNYFQTDGINNPSVRRRTFLRTSSTSRRRTNCHSAQASAISPTELRPPLSVAGSSTRTSRHSPVQP